MLMAIYKMFRGDHSSAELVGRHRARQAFLTMNDRLLADAGISREKLNQGVNAWPWRVEAPDTSVPVVRPAARVAPVQESRKTTHGHVDAAYLPGDQHAVNVDDIAIITAFDEQKTGHRHAA